ncbi:hypothetical protein JHK82_044491 [Glycine max]|nr:hypothetical protein JHK82_044491 [Glycine max]
MGNLDQWLHEPDLSLSPSPHFPGPHASTSSVAWPMEEEQNVVALEEVIRLCGRVVELEGLHKGKVAAQRRCDLRDGSVGEHCHRNPRIVGGVGCDVRDRRGQGSV